MTFSWALSWRTDVDARRLADRHYNRQKIGAAGFVPPGRCLVLKSADRRAFWVTSWPFAEYVRHQWAGAWVCSAFRNEGSIAPDGTVALASDMIRAAVACTIWKWPDPPSVSTEQGNIAMVTFVDADKVRRSRTPGRCYIKAGFRRIGHTQGGLIALGLLVDDLPEPLPYSGSQSDLFAAGEVP